MSHRNKFKIFPYCVALKRSSSVWPGSLVKNVKSVCIKYFTEQFGYILFYYLKVWEAVAGNLMP